MIKTVLYELQYPLIQCWSYFPEYHNVVRNQRRTEQKQRTERNICPLKISSVLISVRETFTEVLVTNICHIYCGTAVFGVTLNGGCL
jgi:hypothetical protein